MSSPTSPITGLPIPRSQTYTGGCHCGRVQYTIKLSPPLSEMPVTKCTCSICHINGQVMVYPLESQITWLSGRDEMTEYSFGPARVAHSFCPVCGTSVGGKSTEDGVYKHSRAINVRTLRGVDLEKLNYRVVDNRNNAVDKSYSYDPSKHPQNGYGARIV